MTKVQTKDRQDAIAQLRDWLKPGDTLYTILDSVSRSGMSRHIRVVIPSINYDDKVQRAHDCKVTPRVDFLHPNHAVATAIGARQVARGDGLVIGGCGMDMGFHVVYSVSEALYGYLRCEACGKLPRAGSRQDGITKRPACEYCGAILAGGYKCLGAKRCPSNYHTNFRSSLRCNGANGKNCWRPDPWRSREESAADRIAADWPRLAPIEIGDGETIPGGLAYCVTGHGDEEHAPIVCPACKGKGEYPNPDGPQRFDLLHTDGYAIHHRWL